MFTQTTRRLSSAAALLRKSPAAAAPRPGVPRGGGGGGCQPRRSLNVSGRLPAKAAPRPAPRVPADIPGLERVTYGERMHFVPGLARPVFPRWERDYKDPMRYTSPPAEEMPLYRDKHCFVFQQRTSALEGVRQALWLTKTQLAGGGLPPRLLSLAQSAANRLPDQDERVQNAIRHARFWDTTEIQPRKDKYCSTLLRSLLHLCGSLQPSHPALRRRILAEKYTVVASWKRGEDLFQVRGQNGLLLSSADPLPTLAGTGEVAETAAHVLETFYPVSPAIDLQRINVYREENHTGFRKDYPYPHAHTVYFLEGGDGHPKLRPEQLRAKMIMFCFGNALARAHTLHGTQPQRVLDQPITVQAVGTNGRIFDFVVFQLNTTDLCDDEGVKNQVWVDQDAQLYDSAKIRPVMRKKEVQVPAGLSGYQPETFSKFLALYLNGAA